MSSSTWSHQAAVVEYPRLSFASHGALIDDQYSTSPNQTSPRKATPNTGRRRLGTLDFTRAEATPSHRVRMANMFQEAAAGIKYMQHSPVAGNPIPCSASNTRRNRISLATYMQRYREKQKTRPKVSEPPVDHQPSRPARQRPTASPEQSLPAPPPKSFNVLPDRAAGKEPVSSGFTSPVAAETRLHYVLPISSSILPPDSDDEECHSTHGVPYIITPCDPTRGLPPPQTQNIDAWLDKLMDPAPEFVPKSPTHSPSKSSLERSSPCRPIFSKKLRRPVASTKLSSPTATSAPGTKQPPTLDAPPGKSYNLILLDEFDPTARTSSNKENLPPPLTSPSWSSDASSPSRNAPPPTSHINPPADHPPKGESPGLFLTPDQYIPRPKSAVSSIRTRSPPNHPTSSLFLTPFLSAPPRKPSHPLSPSSSPMNGNTRSSPPSTHFHPCFAPLSKVPSFVIRGDETPYHQVYGTANDYRAKGDRTPHPRSMEEDGPWAVDSKDVEGAGDKGLLDGTGEGGLEGEEAVQLSPDVERYRKGRARGEGRARRARKRCGSYWDEDILQGVESTRGGNGGTGEEYGEGGGGEEKGYEGDEEIL